VSGFERSATVAIATLALLAGLALSACGGGDDSADPQDEIAATLSRLQQAFNSGDAEHVCSSLTGRARLEVGAAGHGRPVPCEKNLVMFMRGVEKTGERRGASVPSVVAVDLTAMATVRMGRESTAQVPLVWERGEWKVGSFFGFSPRSRFSE
jgi:hypothetical protein